ncbi:MAG: hypothetical protein ACJAV2_000604 [Myxococcota bacterium]|jgi:hypothetical protein
MLLNVLVSTLLVATTKHLLNAWMTLSPADPAKSCLGRATRVAFKL